MPTSIQNLSNNILSICVHESVRVVDVFGRALRKIKIVVKAASFGFAESIGKIIAMKMVFANLNNHSSPPFQTGWTA